MNGILRKTLLLSILCGFFTLQASIPESTRSPKRSFLNKKRITFVAILGALTGVLYYNKNALAKFIYGLTHSEFECEDFYNYPVELPANKIQTLPESNNEAPKNPSSTPEKPESFDSQPKDSVQAFLNWANNELNSVCSN